MRVTLVDKVREKVHASKEQVFLRRDFDQLGNYRQVGRALARLGEEDTLVHAGHGVYTKPKIANSPELVVQKLTKKLGKRVNRKLELGSTVLHIGKSVTYENAQSRLDAFKLRIARAVLKHHSIDEIRRKSLENLARWKAKKTWNPGYAQWEQIMLHASDDDIRNIMSSDIEEPSNRLRQSSPYVGLLDKKIVEELRAKR